MIKTNQFKENCKPGKKFWTTTEKFIYLYNLGEKFPIGRVHLSSKLEETRGSVGISSQVQMFGSLLKAQAT